MPPKVPVNAMPDSVTLPSAVDVNVVVPATPVPVTVHEQAPRFERT